jgi:hypothetical protein
MTVAMTALTRRSLLVAIPAVAVASASGASPALANTVARASLGLSPALRQRALGAMSRHGREVVHTDVMAIVDFSQPSRLPRFHLLDLTSGQSTTLLVAHGRGSDPQHSGWVQRFSNQEGSYASSPGAYVTEDIYQGKHGRSLRLAGLDSRNNLAGPRAIVVHSAWYVDAALARDTGKLGRSEGCFAVAAGDLDQVISRLGRGRMIYADKV